VNLLMSWFSKMLSRSCAAKLKIPPTGPSAIDSRISCSHPGLVVMSEVLTVT
jgi:hypothetical protein